MFNYLLFLIYRYKSTVCQLNLTFMANKHRLKASHLFNDILIRADIYFLLPLQKKYYKAVREIILFKEVSMQSSKLYVGNFNYSTVDSQLEKIFSPFGQIISVAVIGNKGFGFVEMSSPAEALKAKEALDGSDFEGRTLKVNEARPQSSRPDRSSRRY